MNENKKLNDLQKKSLMTACTMAIVQCTKNWGPLKTLPTQIWSFIVTLLLVLLGWIVQEINENEDSNEECSNEECEELNLHGEMNFRIFSHLLFNAALLSFASNGAYLAMYKLG